MALISVGLFAWFCWDRIIIYLRLCTTGEIVAIGFLAIVTFLILWIFMSLFFKKSVKKPDGNFNTLKEKNEMLKKDIDQLQRINEQLTKKLNEQYATNLNSKTQKGTIEEKNRIIENEKNENEKLIKKLSKKEDIISGLKMENSKLNETLQNREINTPTMSMTAKDFILEGNKAAGYKNYKKAIEFYQKAIVENFNAEANYNIGCMHLQIGEYEQAIRCFEKAIEYKNVYEKSYKNMGFAYHKLGNQSKANDCLGKARNLTC